MDQGTCWSREKASITRSDPPSPARPYRRGPPLARISIVRWSRPSLARSGHPARSASPSSGPTGASVPKARGTPPASGRLATSSRRRRRSSSLDMPTLLALARDATGSASDAQPQPMCRLRAKTLGPVRSRFMGNRCAVDCHLKRELWPAETTAIYAFRPAWSFAWQPRSTDRTCAASRLRAASRTYDS